MKMYYDQFGMTYGWLGNRGVIRVTTGIEDEEEYNKFVELYSDYDLNFEKIDFRNFSEIVANTVDKKTNGLFSKNKFAKAAMIAGSFVPGVGVVVAGASVVPVVIRRQKKKQQQYQTLVVSFYREGLAKFLEE